MNAILKGKRGKKKKNKEEVEKGVRWHTVTVVFSLCSVLERFLAGFVLFCFVLFCFVLFCFVMYSSVFGWFTCICQEAWDQIAMSRKT